MNSIHLAWAIHHAGSSRIAVSARRVQTQREEEITEGVWGGSEQQAGQGSGSDHSAVLWGLSLSVA